MMNTNKKTPKFRFKGFTDAWEQRKADYIFKSVTEKGYPELPVLSASQELGMVYRDQNGIDIQHDKKNESSYKRVSPGQFVIHLRSFQGGFAYSEVEGITSPAYTVMSFKNSSEQYCLFWKYVFKSETFIKRLETITYGIRDGRSISFSDFKSLMLQYPSFSEQELIGDLIAIIESGITLHQCKLEKLKLNKSALLQKLFPQNGCTIPEIRFKEFTGAWEQRKLSSLTDYIGTGKSRFVIKEFGDYAILGSTNVIGYDDSYDYDGNFILTARVGANAGQLYRYSGKVKITDNTVFLMSDNSAFLYYALTYFDLRRLSFGTGQPLVKSSELQKLKLSVPENEKEQEKIGEIFNNIDSIITLHQRKLDRLISIKKGLLQQLFV